MKLETLDQALEQLNEAHHLHASAMEYGSALDEEQAVNEAITELIRLAKADAWDEAYRRGIDDERTASSVRVDIGLGPGTYAQAERSNPYRITP